MFQGGGGLKTLFFSVTLSMKFSKKSGGGGGGGEAHPAAPPPRALLSPSFYFEAASLQF